MSELQTELDELPTDYRKAVRRPRGGIFFFLVVAALGATVACARYLSTEVRGLTLDPSLEKYVGWALWVLIATCGIAIAFWADEILFHGDFRRSFVVREKVDRDAAIARQFSKTPAIFSAVVAVGCFVGYQFANAAGSGYFQYYDTVGRHIAQVRMAPHGSVDPGEQTIAAFDALSKTGGPDVTQFLITQLDGEAPKLASYAAWAIGRRHEKYLRKLVVAPLLQATKSTDKALQTTARVALARFQVAAASSLLIESIQASQANNEALDIRLIWGLANTQQPESLEILSDLLYDTSPEVARGAAYALAQLRDTPAGGKAVTVLEQRLPAADFDLRCALIQSLGILSYEQSNLAMMKAFDATPQEQREKACPLLPVVIRPDGEGDDRHVLFLSPLRNNQETLGMLTIIGMGGIRATAPEVRAVVEPWLSALIADEKNSYQLRESAKTLLKGIEAQSGQAKG